MKPTENPTVTNDPKQNGDTGKTDNTSNPKDPNNDPDQTPEKEIQDPPQSNPSQNNPGENDKQKIGFNYED